MKTNTILSCLLAVLLPGLALAVPPNGKGPRNIDANGDGAITQAEAKKADAPRLLQNFAEIDADGNGELTREELRAHRKDRMQTRRQEHRSRAQAADTDGDGALSADEAKAAGMRRLVDNFAAIDTNGDGEVTRAEMRKLRQTRDGDGTGQGPRGEPGQRQGQGPANRGPR